MVRVGLNTVAMTVALASCSPDHPDQGYVFEPNYEEQEFEIVAACLGSGEVPEPCSQFSGGPMGLRYCFVNDDVETWTECLMEEPECRPGEVEQIPCDELHCAYNGSEFAWLLVDNPDCATPLVVQIDAQPLTFEVGELASFAFTPDIQCISSDWPSLPWLALDRNHNGFIDDGTELFGSGMALPTGARASNGFEALGQFDKNGDHRISAADPVFSQLVLWSDADGDRLGNMYEQIPLAATGIESISLDAALGSDCDGRGNCAGERATLTRRTDRGQLQTGAVIDVYMHCQL